MESSKKQIKAKPYPTDRVYIIKESYDGVKKLSDIFADLLYSAYKDKPKNTDKKCG